MKLTDTFSKLDANHEEMNSLIGNEGLQLVYEDDIESDPRIGAEKIAQQLGIDAQFSSVPLKRTKSCTPKEELSNWPDVVLTLKDTKWSWMLDSI